MLRTMLLALTLLASAAWVQAQSQYPQTNPTGTSAASTSGQTTVQGCLQESNGNYTLTSDTGTSYQLSGDTSKLSKHVGHEVEITGATSSGSSAAAPPSSGTNPSASTSTGTSGTSQTLNVDNVKHISKSCKNTSK